MGISCNILMSMVYWYFFGSKKTDITAKEAGIKPNSVLNPNQKTPETKPTQMISNLHCAAEASLADDHSCWYLTYQACLTSHKLPIS